MFVPMAEAMCGCGDVWRIAEEREENFGSLRARKSLKGVIKAVSVEPDRPLRDPHSETRRSQNSPSGSNALGSV